MIEEEYKSGDKKHGCCSCCGYETETTFYKDRAPIYQEGMRMTNDVWFCSLCSHTTASNCFIYNNRYDFELRPYIKAILYVGNSILHEIRKLNPNNKE